jgi:hypothetical protein
LSNLPQFRRQIGDPTTSLDSFICTLESGAMALDFTTGGQVSVWGGQLIPYCGRKPSEIVGKGTNLQNVDLAWHHYGQDLDIRDGPYEEVVKTLKAGDAVVAQGWYDALPSIDRCSKTFETGHAVYVHPAFNGDKSSVLVGDPLCAGYRYMRLSSLRAYMEELARKVRNDENRLFFGRAPKFQLPDTDTEEPEVPGLVVTKVAAASGVAKTKLGGKHAAVQVSDREYFFLEPGTAKRVVGQGILVPPLDGNAGDRASVWLTGDELAVLLKMDVDYTPDTASTFNQGVDAASKKALEAKR